MKENITALIHEIKARLEVLKDGPIKKVCDQYGREAESKYEKFITGDDEQEAIDFLRYWMPWLYVNSIVKKSDLKQLEESERLNLHIVLDNQRNALKWHDKRVLAINSHVKVTGSGRVFSFDSKVDLYDESTAHLHGNSICNAKSGWIFAYNKSEVHAMGRGIVEAYDFSTVTLDGTWLAFQYDNATVASNLRSTVITN